MFVFEHMVFPISRLPSPLLALPYPKLCSGGVLLVVTKARVGSMICFGFLACFSAYTWVNNTHTHTPVAQVSISGVHVLNKLGVQALRGCLSLRILNQAVGSLLSKIGTLVRVGS